jgi:hypothetical protein
MKAAKKHTVTDRSAPAKATTPADFPVDSKRRRLVALEATYQIAALFEAVKEKSRCISAADDLDAVAVIRALVFRGSALSSVAMLALGDDDGQSAEEVEDMEKVVEGATGELSDSA